MEKIMASSLTHIVIECFIQLFAIYNSFQNDADNISLAGTRYTRFICKFLYTHMVCNAYTYMKKIKIARRFSALEMNKKKKEY